METKIKDRLDFDKETGICQTAGAPKTVALFWSNKHQEICWDDITEVYAALKKFGCDIDPDLINDLLQFKYANAVSYECGMLDSSYEIAELIGYGSPYDDSYWYGQLQYIDDFKDTIVFERKEHDLSKLGGA